MLLCFKTFNAIVDYTFTAMGFGEEGDKRFLTSCALIFARRTMRFMTEEGLAEWMVGWCYLIRIDRRACLAWIGL